MSTPRMGQVVMIVKVVKNGPSKVRGRKPLKNLYMYVHMCIL